MGDKETLEALNKLYENDGIVNLGKTPRVPVKKPLRRPSMQYLTDGGYPMGRLILHAGEKSSGKSSNVIQTCGELYDKILYIDTEYTLTTDYIEQLGVDPSKFDHAMPTTTESMMDLIRKNIKNYECVIIDSINNSASAEQLQKNAGDRTMANRAIVFSSQLPIIVGMANQSNTTLHLISQVRQNMDKVNKYSEDYVITGGESLHHNSSMTLVYKPSSQKKAKEKDEMSHRDTIEGRMITIKCTKNKVGTPFRTVQMEFTYGEGFTIEADVASAALRKGLFTMAGSWIKYNGDSIAQGMDNLIQVLKDNPELVDVIISKLDELDIQERES